MTLAFCAGVRSRVLGSSWRSKRNVRIDLPHLHLLRLSSLNARRGEDLDERIPVGQRVYKLAHLQPTEGAQHAGGEHDDFGTRLEAKRTLQRDFVFVLGHMGRDT